MFGQYPFLYLLLQNNLRYQPVPEDLETVSYNLLLNYKNMLQFVYTINGCLPMYLLTVLHLNDQHLNKYSRLFSSKKTAAGTFFAYSDFDFF